TRFNMTPSAPLAPRPTQASAAAMPGRAGSLTLKSTCSTTERDITTPTRDGGSARIQWDLRPATRTSIDIFAVDRLLSQIRVACKGRQIDVACQPDLNCGPTPGS